MLGHFSTRDVSRGSGAHHPPRCDATCSLTVLSPSLMVLILKSMPMVVMNVDEKVPSAYRSNRHVLPTPALSQPTPHPQRRPRHTYATDHATTATAPAARPQPKPCTPPLVDTHGTHRHQCGTLQRPPTLPRDSRVSDTSAGGRPPFHSPLLPTVSSLICMSCRSGLLMPHTLVWRTRGHSQHA